MGRTVPTPALLLSITYQVVVLEVDVKVWMDELGGRKSKKMRLVSGTSNKSRARRYRGSRINCGVVSD